MTDYSIKEITIIDGGVNKMSEFEAPGDYQVSVLIDYAPPKGALYRRVHAIVRDRHLAIFPSSFIPEHEKDIFPLLGTVYGVNAAIAKWQVYGGPGGVPTKLRIEESPNLLNVYAKAAQIQPPRLPLGQKIDPVEGKTKTKTQVDPDAPYAAYQTFDGGPVRDGQVIGADGTLFDIPRGEPTPDPIGRFLDALTPMIEKMAELTAIPVQIVPDRTEDLKRLVGVRDVTIGGKSPVNAVMADVNRAHRRAGPFECEVKPVDIDTPAIPTSRAGVYTRGPGESWVRIDMPVSEFRALLSEKAFTVLADQDRDPQRAVQFANAIASHMLRFLRTQGAS